MAFTFEVTLTLVTKLLFACVLFHLSLATCPQNRSPVLDDKIIGSEVVVQGRVRGQVKVNPRDSFYTAVVDVHCVFKGSPVSLHINVTGAGKEEGKCVQTELVEGNMYLIYLKHAPGGTFTPTFTQDPADRKYLDELQYVCGLHVQLPTGLDRSKATVSCPPEIFADYELVCPDMPSSPEPSSAAEVLRAVWTMSGFVSVVLASLLLLHSL